MFTNTGFYCPYLDFSRGQQNSNIGQMMYYNGHSDYIIHCADGDVNGDRIADSVCTVGNRPGDLQSPFVEDITLLIQDGKTHKYTRIPLKENVGYNPTVFLGDFNKDHVNDIFVSIDSGGSGGFSFDYVYSFLDNVPKLMYDSEAASLELEYEVNYRDNYKVEVLCNTLKKKYIIDISDRGNDYLNEIYNPNGTLKTPLQGDVIPVGNTYPVDYQRDGVYDLNLMQRVIGRYNADTMGIIQTTLEWDGSKFTPTNQMLSIFGSDIG